MAEGIHALEMSIGPLVLHVRNRCVRYSFSPGEVTNALSLRHSSPQIYYLRGREFRVGATMPLSSRILFGVKSRPASVTSSYAAFRFSIPRVASGGIEEEMIGVHAPGIVPARAVVADEHSFRDRSSMDLPGEAMSAALLTVHENVAVNLDATPSPEPAGRSFFNLCPETL